jgi:hypothetical protein
MTMVVNATCNVEPIREVDTEDKLKYVVEEILGEPEGGSYLEGSFSDGNRAYNPCFIEGRGEDLYFYNDGPADDDITCSSIC